MFWNLRLFTLFIPFNLPVSGKSNGKGYYIYEKGSKPKPDSSVLPIIEESRKVANVMPRGQVLISCLVK